MATSLIAQIAAAAASLSEEEGLRTQSQTVVENLSDLLDAAVTVVVRGRADDGVADLLAANGLGPADYRRFEERVAKSALWRIFSLRAPVAIDDVAKASAIDFLAFGPQVRFFISVPIVYKDRAVGFIGAGFAAGRKVDEESTIRVLEIFSPMIGMAIRSEHSSAAEIQKLRAENEQLRLELRERFDFSRLIGNSPQIRQVYEQAIQIARSSTTVLIRGESGTGKALIAQLIHHNSLRAKRPLIRIACSRTNGGAAFVRKASGATLLLEEIQDLSLNVQADLREILESRRERYEANVRFIVTSSKNLELLAASGEVHPELLELLSRFTIRIPPLRERTADILLLAEHFLKRFEAEHKKNVRRISTPAIDMLTAYHFPGNVRELENVIEQALLACDSNVIHGHDLPPTLQTAEVSDTATKLTLTAAVEAFERDLITDTLKSTAGNIAEAARRLASTERILGYKIKNYGIEPRRFKR